MWFLQFFFYSWGEAQYPVEAGLCELDAAHEPVRALRRAVGLALGEWKGVGSRPLRLLWAGILVIIAAANLVGLGMAS